MTVQIGDLFYIDRGGVLYQITAQQLIDRDLASGDLLLVERGGRYYQVDIQDLWDTVKELDPTDDYLLAQREQELYHVHYAPTPFFAIRFFGSQVADGADLFTIDMAAAPWEPDKPAFILQPDGTRTTLTTDVVTYTFTKPGIYRFTGDFTEFQIKNANCSVDAGLSKAIAWQNLLSRVTNLGTELFTNIYNLVAVPDRLRVYSLIMAFMGSGINQDCNLGEMNVASVADATMAFKDTVGGCDISPWKVSGVQNMTHMFYNSDVNSDLTDWDVGNVKNMSFMFAETSRFNGDITEWSPSSVTNMAGIFSGAAIFDQDINDWVVDNVLDMSSAFEGALAFNHPLNGWDVGSVKDMNSMFLGAVLFDQDLSRWTVGGVTNMDQMFKDAEVFNGNVTTWATVSVRSYLNLFNNAKAFNQDIGGWDTSSISDFTSMFEGAEVFNVDLGYWDVSSATDMTAMFKSATIFDRDLSGWCVRWISEEPDDFNSDAEFANTEAFQPEWGVCPAPKRVIFFTFDGNGTIKVKGTYDDDTSGYIQKPDGTQDTGITGTWNRSYTEAGSYIISSETLNAISFEGSTGEWFFKPLSYTSHLKTLNRAFHNCYTFDSDISWWDVSNVSDLSYAFWNCNNMRTSLAPWSVSKNSNLSHAFYNCNSWRSDLSAWDFGNVTNMTNAFYLCSVFNSRCDEWNLTNVTNFSYAFYKATRFNQPCPDWNTSNMLNMRSGFQCTSAFDQDISTWCVLNVTDYNYFTTGSKFQNKPDLHPVWRTCPPQVINYPVIAPEDDSSLIVAVDAPVIILSDALTDPRGTSTNQWQTKRVGDSLAGFLDVPFQTGDEYITEEGDSRVRLKQTVTTSEGVRVVYSNEVRVDIGGFGDFIAIKVENMLGSVLIQGTREGEGYIFNSLRQRVIVPDGDFSIAFAENGIYLIGSENLKRVSFENTTATFTVDPESYTEDLTNCYRMFANISNMVQDLDFMQTGNVLDMSEMFHENRLFDGSLEGWDVSRVENMSKMFYNANKFFGEFAAWDTASLKDASSMLFNCKAFRGDMSTWDLSSVTNASYMFYNVVDPDAGSSKWKMPALVDGYRMFYRANIGGTGENLSFKSLTNAHAMFYETYTGGFDTSKWDLNKVQDASNMFYQSSSISNWVGMSNLSMKAVTNTAHMFYASGLNQSIDNLGLQNVENMSQMLSNCRTFNHSVANWTLTNVVNMYAAFFNCHAFNQPLTAWGEFPELTNAASMFGRCYAFNQPLPNWSFSKAAGMNYMFDGATVFIQDISSWCVPLISSKPSGFDSSSGFLNQPFIQPQWGTCPPLSVVTPVIKNSTNSNGINGDPGDVLEVETDGETSEPAATFTNQWQVRKSGAADFIDATGETGATYTVAVDDVEVRLVQDFTGANGSLRLRSNTITIAAEPAWPFIAVEATGGGTLVIQGLRSGNNGFIVGPDGTEYELEPGNFRRNFFNATGTYVIQADPGLVGINFSGTTTGFSLSNQSDFSNVTDLSRLFQSCSRLTGTFDWMDTSNVTNLAYAWSMSSSLVSSGTDISTWDVGNVTNFFAMTNNYSGPRLKIADWVAPDAGNLSYAFQYCHLGRKEDGFVDLESMTFGNITNMISCFQYSNMRGLKTEKAEYNISHWDVSNLVYNGLQSAFNQAQGNQASSSLNVKDWDVSNVTDFITVANGCGISIDMGNWVVNKSSKWYAAFNYSYKYENQTFNIAGWDVSNFTNMYQMFGYTSWMTENIEGWRTGNVTDMSSMFYNSTRFDQNLSQWCVPKIPRLPNGFDTNSGFEKQYDIQPPWSTCPPFLVTRPVIEAVNGTWGPSGSTITITQHAVTNPVTTGLVTTWQAIRDDSAEFIDIVNPTPGDTYEAQDDDIAVRIKEVATTPDGNGTYYSASVRVSSSAPALDQTFSFSVSNATVTKKGFISGSRYGVGVVTDPSGGATEIDGQFLYVAKENGEYTVTANDLKSIKFQNSTADVAINNTSFTSDLVSLVDLYRNTKQSFGYNLSWMDVSNVTNMAFMFYKDASTGVTRPQDFDLTGWNVESLVDLTYAFGSSKYTTYLPIGVGSWTNTEKITTLNQSFVRCNLMGQDFSNWDMSSVSKGYQAFYAATSNGADFTGWTFKFDNNSNVGSMFNAMSVNSQVTADSIGTWDLSDCDTLSSSFFNSLNASGKDFDISSWGLSNVRTLSSTFYNMRCGTLEASGWTFPENSSLFNTFSGFSGTLTGLSSWNTSNVVNFKATFSQSSASIPDLTWDVSNATTFTQLFYAFSSNPVPDLSSWNTSKVTDLYAAFFTTRHSLVGLESWDVSNVTNFAQCFFGRLSNPVPDVSEWDVGKGHNFSQMFQNCNLELPNISGWDVSNAVDMNYMLRPSVYNASIAFPSISAWNMSKAANVQGMVMDTTINEDLSTWNTSNFYYANSMFFNAQLFNADIHTWCVSRIRGYSGFDTNAAIEFQPLKKPQWGKCPPRTVTKVIIEDPQSTATELGHTVRIKTNGVTSPSATSVNQWQRRGEIDLNFTDVPDATGETYEIELDDLRGEIRLLQTFTDSRGAVNRMYSNALYVLDIVTPQGMAVTFSTVRSGVDALIHIKGEVTQPSTITYQDGTVTNINGAFDLEFTEPGTYFIMTNFMDRLSFENTTLSVFIAENSEVTRIHNMSNMFFNVKSFNQDLSWWDTSGVTNMRGLFQYAQIFNGKVDSWDMTQVTDTSFMFDNAFSFNQELGSWRVFNVTEMESMFAGARSFNQDISEWDVGNVADFHFLFKGAIAFNSQLPWDVKNSTNMYGMFFEAKSFNANISTWNTKSVVNMLAMFEEASAFNQNIGIWNVATVDNMGAMFDGAKAFNQDLSGWCVAPAPFHQEFDTDSGFAGKPELQPQWGTCP